MPTFIVITLETFITNKRFCKNFILSILSNIQILLNLKRTIVNCPYCRSSIKNINYTTYNNEQECIVCFHNTKTFVLFNSCIHEICSDCYNYQIID